METDGNIEISVLRYKLLPAERETLLNYDAVDKRWVMDSMVSKHYQKAIRQGWTPIRKYVYKDGTVVGMTLVAPERAITIRNVNKKTMSDKQLSNLDDGDE